MIQLTRLRKVFGPLTAVDGIDMTVRQGEVLGFLGPNGAGKSTTMKMVAGFLAPTSGTALVDGIDVISNPVEVKRRLGYLPEGAPCYGDMTPLTFLRFIAEIRGIDGKAREAAVAAAVEKVAIEGVLDQSIETLSKGFKRRVGLAQAILHNPPVLILDEPTDGLDPNQKHQVRELIRGMAADKAVVISTHILEEVEAVCTRAVIIAKGRLLADGTPAELLARSPLHNALRIEVDNAGADAVLDDVRNMPGIAAVELVDAGADVSVIRIRSAAGSITIDVAAMLKSKGHRVRDLATEKGALDAIFREITIGGGASHA
ncbi:MAG: ABC transporter ATP-binding protein [Proteobacteria bacterium]|nr:ABC transporter ATP-binding protein [Pseudomonadota bacterium]